VSQLRSKRLLVVAQGSGGHVFPAVAFCQEFILKNPESVLITFVTSANAKFVASDGQKANKIIPEEFHPVYLSASRSALGILKLIFSSFGTIIRERPDIVFGFGGYFTVPFVFWAKLFGKKTILHEQNVVLGRANMFLSGWVDKIIISFEETRMYLKKNNKKTQWARFPLKENLRRMPKNEALQVLGFKEGLLTVLVVGGSQGARCINERIPEALKENKNLDQLQVIHLAGHNDFKSVKERYRALPLCSKVFEFFDDMQVLYSAADLVIGRSGAGCVAEISHFALPSVLIPYPYAGAHQIENARVLAKKGAALLLEEDKITAPLLSGLLDIFIEDDMRRKTMSKILTTMEEEAQKISLSEAVFL
jgi:UDP-N-acetylglucosamine--N-acetylmuramyl-(pentapeptide) pyrophosphoryl-undecaprenol N-acetylglucosamine transferase